MTFQERILMPVNTNTNQPSCSWQRADTDWFKSAKFGIFLHFLAETYLAQRNNQLTSDEWNSIVDSVDVDNIANQAASTGAGYCMFTIGQNSGFYCAPNPVYDEIAGTKPSKCSRRDLIADIAAALGKKNIRLLAYTSSGAPCNDLAAVERLQWRWGFENVSNALPMNWCYTHWVDEKGVPIKETRLRLAEFQKKWEAILAYWSKSWGRNVAGWWIDGCYFADAMYRHTDEPNFRSFTAALKAGNCDSIVAYNSGVITPVISITEYEDYTAGEINNAFPVESTIMPISRFVDGAQYHILSFLGQTWGSTTPRFKSYFPAAFTRDITQRQGVVTWDVPIGSDSVIPGSFLAQLTKIGKAVRH
jgi:hypothetical protein